MSDNRQTQCLYFGTLGEFNPKREDWENYVDRLERLKDKFVIGINDARMTKNLMVIPEENLDLQKALDTALALELA